MTDEEQPESGGVPEPLTREEIEDLARAILSGPESDGGANLMAAFAHVPSVSVGPPVEFVDED